MSTIISTAIINLIVWVPTIIRSKHKSQATTVAVISYALSLSTIAAIRYLLTF
jgi:hypothetical protein